MTNQTSIDVIIRAQQSLMALHDVTSETALGLLVWTATDRGTTVLEVARMIPVVETATFDGQHGARHDPQRALHAIA